jgi:predicted DNA-binding transcriptional regulator AlpA
MELLKIHEVCSLTRLSRAGIYRRIADSGFPHGIHIGARSRVWEKRSVLNWLSARPNYRAHQSVNEH